MRISGPFSWSNCRLAVASPSAPADASGRLYLVDTSSGFWLECHDLGVMESSIRTLEERLEQMTTEDGNGNDTSDVRPQEEDSNPTQGR